MLDMNCLNIYPLHFFLKSSRSQGGESKSCSHYFQLIWLELEHDLLLAHAGLGMVIQF